MREITATLDELPAPERERGNSLAARFGLKSRQTTANEYFCFRSS